MADLPKGTSLWTEPESAANTDYPPMYPYNSVTQTQSGHSFEMDDTPTRERIRLQHRSNTFIEMHPNGDEVHKIYGKSYEIVINGKNVEITGDCNITINGNANFQINGDKTEKISGDYILEVAGDLKMRSRGTNGILLQGDKYIDITTDTAVGGTMSMTAGDHIYLNSDVEVSGSLGALLINSQTRVDAVTGINAGELGFFTTGPIVAAEGTIGILGTVLAFDIINGARYDVHTHPAPHGVTGIPLAPFIPI